MYSVPYTRDSDPDFKQGRYSYCPRYRIIESELVADDTKIEREEGKQAIAYKARKAAEAAEAAER